MQEMFDETGQFLVLISNHSYYCYMHTSIFPLRDKNCEKKKQGTKVSHDRTRKEEFQSNNNPLTRY